MRLRLLALANAPAFGARLAGACAISVAACLLAAPAARAQESAAPAKGSSTVMVSRPLWVQLKPEQQEALKPLAPHWEDLSEAHKRKWIALSRNYRDMSPEGRETLHSRMNDWAGLSFQQRAQARLNFAEIHQLNADERKSKWEAYQALSEDERARLARATPRATGAALALQPVPARKLVPIPAVAPAAEQQRTPRIQLAPPPPRSAAPAAPVAAPSDAPLVAQ